MKKADGLYTDDDDEFLDVGRIAWHETNGWIAEIEDDRNVYMNASNTMGFIPLTEGNVMSDVEDDDAAPVQGGKLITGLPAHEERRLLGDLLGAYWPGELIKLLCVIALMIGGLMAANDTLSTILILASVYAAFNFYGH
jgi:hypothetical protein